MIAFDTNILVYAHRRDSPFHAPAARAIDALVARQASWALPWPCLHEFLGIVTHPKIYVPPSSLGEAFGQIELWLCAPGAHVIGESFAHLKQLQALAVEGKISGAAFHDARIAAICLQHGVSELWTADRDFSRYPALKTRNPLVS